MANTFATELEAQDFAFDLENKLKPLFPDNMLELRTGKALIPGYNITMWFTVGKNRSEYESGIIHNDPAYMILHIYANSLSVSHIGSGLRKAGIKKLSEKNKGTIEQIIAHIVKYFTVNAEAIKALKKPVRY